MLIRLMISATILQFAPAAQAQSATTQPPSVRVHQSERRELRPSSIGDSLPRILQVALPGDYADSVGKRYPVVFVLDGDGLFPLVSDVTRLLALSREIPATIVVGLSYDRPYQQTRAARTRDLTPTISSTNPRTGGAHSMLQFLNREVIPFVDSSYRTLGDRTLVGHSFGGLFALHALLESPGAFRRYLIGSPSPWEGGAWFARRDSAFKSRPDPQTTVYLSVGGTESLALLSSWRRTADILGSSKYSAVTLITEILSGESHVSAIPVSTVRGLKALFR